jgi:hypothetical protein
MINGRIIAPIHGAIDSKNIKTYTGFVINEEMAIL